MSALATLALYKVPGLHFIATPLLYLSTLVHEMGHGVGALLSGGEWADFHMFKDGSGYARTTRGSDFAMALTCAAGLVGPAVAAAVFMAMGLRARLARYALGATGAFFALSLVLWVRGSFGVAFVAIVAAACLGIALKASHETARIALLFFATQLALSVYSRGDYLFEDYVDGQMSDGKRTASDVQMMSDALGMPYWFWGLTCAAFSAAVLLGALWLYMRQPRIRPSRPAP
ncbi:MAG TPA: M50 family metallopeptidase [Kofleriaceae bacterium]|nr:M50 family metallopeptidase [Kofleriaceae bacterium]